MTDKDDLSYLPLKVIHVGGNGRRVFDAEAKRRLTEACRRPGVSISGMALKVGVNANQLPKWIRGRGCGPALVAAGDSSSELVLPAFMPVVAIDDLVVPASEVSKTAANSAKPGSRPITASGGISVPNSAVAQRRGWLQA